MTITRREFLEAAAVGAAGLAVSGTAKSYSQILGANDRLNFAVIGLNSRGYAHLSSLKANQSAARISHVCDVDSNILKKFAESTQHEMGEAPATDKDFRNILAQKDVDAITIATPDHWHTPLAIAGLQAGKHVYVEKPCSHNPAEGEMLVQAQQKYKKLVQMGTQQRSSDYTIEIVDKIHSGLIGRPYYAKAWYCNVRKSIGTGKEVPVPAQLDWDLWQGPAPRRPYAAMCILITGTGSEFTAPVKRSTMARMKSMSAAGRSASIFPIASPPPAGDTSSKTTGSSTTRSSPASNMTTK